MCRGKERMGEKMQKEPAKRKNQMRSQPACLYFMMQLQKAIGNVHEITFNCSITIWNNRRSVYLLLPRRE